MVVPMITSCDKYYYVDKLQGIGSRVEILEKDFSNINTEIKSLQQIIEVIEAHGYITSVVHNDDGTSTLTFNNGTTITLRDGKQGTDGKDGRDGIELDMLISVAQDTDGEWYWTVNGEWIYDQDGNKVKVTGDNGKDGQRDSKPDYIDNQSQH